MNKSTSLLAEKARKDFPIFSRELEGHINLVYFDHAATSQKPIQVLNALQNYYSYQNANVHRGAHQLSAIATEAFENARTVSGNFINAYSNKEIVFTRNATEAINLVSNSWGNSQINENDEILISLMEHHSNIVPWQILAQRKGCKINYIGITETGELDINDLQKKLNSKTKLVSITHISNALGCCNPIQQIADIVHKSGALLLVDACQSLAHQKVDVQKLDIDFLAGSSHKLCGPTGSGFLWAREEILERMPPFLGGGEMIEEVFLDKSSWSELPYKFEAGTPAIGEAIGMASALNYLESIGLEKIHEYEKQLTKYLFDKLEEIENITILGPKPIQQNNRGALATFNIKNIHSDDIAALLDTKGICIRSGHHCCQPLHRYYKVDSSARVSLSFTSTIDEIDFFVEQLIANIQLIKKYN